MKTVTVNKFGVGSLGKVVGFYQAIVGLVLGLLTTIGVAANELDASNTFIHNTGISLTLLGFGVIVFPFVMFVLGYIQGVIMAFVLNIVFAESNGLQLEIEEQK